MDSGDSWQNLTVLLVEDDDLIREGLAFYLQESGVRVTSVETAEDGLAILKEQDYDLIIGDYRLPGMNGLEFFQQARNRSPRAVRVMMTAYASAELEVMAAAAGVHNFFQKPLTAPIIQQIMEAVTQHLQSSRPMGDNSHKNNPPTGKSELKMKNILVIDDSATMRRMVMASLKQAGLLGFIEAGSGLEALEQLALGPVDLMILDLNMPDMHGLEVLRFVREQSTFRDIPILILTTRGDEGMKSEALSAGASAYLTKPFEPNKLTKQVKKLLETG